MVASPPTVVAGRYRIGRPLGRGGMGAVYLAEHVNTGERVALKLMTAEQFDADLVARFRREARASARIGGENVVRVLDADVDEDEGVPFLVMELLDGVDLAQMLAERGPLPPTEVARLLEEACRGIERAHAAGVVHRDLKPENLFVHTTAEGKRVVKVLDFGIARVQDPEIVHVTKTGELVGTPQYMAPEQVRGQNDRVGPWTDVWALGMVAFELLTGATYWTAKNPSALFVQIAEGPRARPSERFPALPPGFDAWFLRSCAREPAMRWARVRDQIEALMALAATRDVARSTSDPRASSGTVPAAGVTGVALAPTVPLPPIPARREPAPPPRAAPAPAPSGRPASRHGAIGVAAIGVAVLVAGGVAIAKLATRSTSGQDDASIPPATSSLATPEPTADDPPEVIPAPTLATSEPTPPPSPRPRPPAPDPSAPPGFLTVSTYPWAEVVDEGRILCSTPCRRVPLAPGRHAILFRNPEHGIRTVHTIVVQSGREHTIALKLGHAD